MFKRWVTILCCIAMLCSCLPAAAKGESGIFEGTAKGFGGEVRVSVTLTDGSITAVEAVGDDETPGVGSRAIEELPEAIVQAGSTQVDGVAGATITSDAVKKAVEQALQAASGSETEEVAANMTPGTYRGSAKGMNGTIVVDVTVDEQNIQCIR